ncbi:MAG: hypothetical protein A2Y15_01645 [Clostridiales bacterium GWF2_36_10]|nr:MAG: hypothetical protein A2Y15_01645 [Clostridiales bacterium GWF2_36_10]
MDKKLNKGTKKYKISFLFLLIIAAVTFCVIFREFNLNDIINEILSSSHKPYLIVACLMSIFYLMLYGKFVEIGTRAYGERISHFRSFIYGCADFFYSAITPSASGGQPVVIFLMAKDGLSYSTSVITVILQTISFKFVLLFYNILSLFFVWSIITTINSIFIIFLIIGTVVSIAGIILCFTSMYRTEITGVCGRAIINFLVRIRIIRHKQEKLAHFEKTLSEYKEAAINLKGKKYMLFKMFIVTFLQRTVMFSIAYFVYRSFGLNDFNIIQFFCIQASVSLAVDSIPLPGSMGANEYATYLLYGHIYGTNNNMSAAAMLLTRGFSYYFTLLVSGIFILSKHIFDVRKVKRI